MNKEIFVPGDIIYVDKKLYVVLKDEALDEAIPNKTKGITVARITTQQQNTDNVYGYRLDSRKYPVLDKTCWIQFDQVDVIHKEEKYIEFFFRLDFQTRLFASPKMHRALNTISDKWLQK